MSNPETKNYGALLIEGFVEKINSGKHIQELQSIAIAYRDGEFAPAECRAEAIKVLAALRRKIRKMEGLLKLATDQ